MRAVRLAVLLFAVLLLVAAGSSAGASQKAAFKATLTAAGHAPKAKSTWRYHVRVTDLKGHPIWARVTSQIVDPLGTAHLVEFDGTGHNPYVKNYRFFGNFCDSITWPTSAAVGVTLRFQTVVVTATGRTVLTYPVTPRQ